MEESLLQVKQLSCIRQEKLLFQNLSFELKQGRLLLIEGENGVGKSSLLRLLAGLATPASGQITWQQKPILELKSNYFKNMHYVSHANGLKLGLTIKENLALLASLSFCANRNTLSELAHFSLLSEQTTLVKQLSAGQKRKLALIHLLTAQKKLWILDEPLTALDANSQSYFLNKLLAHLEQTGMVIMTSHHNIALPNDRIKKIRLVVC